MKCLLIAACVLLTACPKNNDRPSPKEPTGNKDGGTAGAPADAGAIVLAPAPPLPAVPAGLPAAPALDASPEAVALGELLFWERRLSPTNTVSCATCHDPLRGYAGTGRQHTADDKPNLRRAPALVNLAWQRAYGWDGRYGSIAEQLGAHVRGQLGDELATAIARIGDVPAYRAHFARLGGAPSAEVATTALVAYVSTRYSGDAPWDRVERSPDVPADIKAGYQIFSGKAQCAVCHTPPLYTDHRYHRLGLIGRSPELADEGRGRVDPAQRGAFKTPTLRDAAARASFFHDGSASSLDAAIDWHLAGGTGHGADPSIIDPALRKVMLTPVERAQLGAFVRALTDPAAVPTKPALP